MALGTQFLACFLGRPVGIGGFVCVFNTRTDRFEKNLKFNRRMWLNFTGSLLTRLRENLWGRVTFFVSYWSLPSPVNARTWSCLFTCQTAPTPCALDQDKDKLLLHRLVKARGERRQKTVCNFLAIKMMHSNTYCTCVRALPQMKTITNIVKHFIKSHLKASSCVGQHVFCRGLKAEKNWMSWLRTELIGMFLTGGLCVSIDLFYYETYEMLWEMISHKIVLKVHSGIKQNCGITFPSCFVMMMIYCDLDLT